MADIDICYSYGGQPVRVTPYQPAKPTLLERHVAWLRKNKESGGIAAIAVRALMALEALVLSLSLIGIIPMVKASRIWRKGKAMEQFDAHIKEKKLIPPPDDPLYMKTKTRSFNHFNDYAIEGGMVWFRRRTDQGPGEWKPIYLDGWEKGVRPVEISVDGVNLVVLDQERRVRYKKVAKEYRTHHTSYPDEGNFKKNRHLCKEKLSENSEYFAVDKSGLNNWKNRWFSLPIYHAIVNLFEGKLLTIPQDAKAFAMSQRGRFNDALFDRAGNPDYANVGVTTLYVLDKNGRDIIKYDPWSPKHAQVKLFMPETEEKAFIAENLSASASTLMVVGYDVDQKTGKKNAAIYTNLADIDSMGWNPGLSYTPFENEGNKSQKSRKPKIVAPIEPKWKSHPLPEGAEVSSSITIVQTGSGNKERQLRVEGWSHGVEGIFYKKIDEAGWQFEGIAHSTENPPLQEKQGERPEQTVRNWENGLLKGTEWKASLTEFGPRSYLSTLKITQGKEIYELPLQKRKALGAFLGFGGTINELIIPEELHENSSLQKIFGRKKIIPISISEKAGSVEIKTKRTAKKRIFTFSRVKEK